MFPQFTLLHDLPPLELHVYWSDVCIRSYMCVCTVHVYAYYSNSIYIIHI